MKKILYGEVAQKGTALDYTPSSGGMIQAFYYTIPTLKFGQWAELITTSTNAYGSSGKSGSSSSSTSGSSGYSSSYLDYLNYLNYANSYYGSGGYYGGYYGGYNGNYYGTLKSEVEKRLEAGKVVVLVIAVHGAANIRRMFPGATTVFLLPPSVEELEHRLRGRGTEDEAKVQKRLETAKGELEQKDKFDYVVVNDTVARAVDEIKGILASRR